ncbi:HTH_38 domain-containing protein [Trichonephila clavipes]|nr:HTH_38 domain-containing protein [Trichonephila clavipes]
MTVPDRSVTSRTVAQHIESVRICAYHSKLLQQSGLYARHPLLGLPLNTDISAPNGTIRERCGLQNGMKLSLLTNHSSVCNTTMVGFESRDTVERRC